MKFLIGTLCYHKWERNELYHSTSDRGNILGERKTKRERKEKYVNCFHDLIVLLWYLSLVREVYIIIYMIKKKGHFSCIVRKRKIDGRWRRWQVENEEKEREMR